MEKPKVHWTEIVKNIVETIALLVGGGWAFYIFVVQARPALALRDKVSSTLKWELPSYGKTVHAEFYVSLENIGTTKFDITQAKVTVWTFDEIALDSNQKIKAFDLQHIREMGHSIYCESFDIKNGNTLFVGTYVQGTEWSDNLEFLMAPDPKKMVLFYIEFYEGNDKKPFDWTYHWDYIGGVKSVVSGNGHSKIRERKGK